MAYAIENARFQWEEGERRVRFTDEVARSDLERAVEAVLDELRRRLGSTFAISELADLYGSGTDWADDIAQRARGGGGAGLGLGVVVQPLGLLAGALQHDAVRLDGDRHGTVPGPVLRVDGVV